MSEVTRHFWHENYVPRGLSAPAPRLYRCIKSWKKCIKSDFKEISFETCNKWPKWQDIPVDIKISSPRGCQPMPRGYIHVLNHEKKMYKIRLQRDLFFTLVANNQSDQRFLLTSKCCPLGLSAHDLRLFTFKWWPWVDLDHFYDRVKFVPDASVWVTA